MDSSPKKLAAAAARNALVTMLPALGRAIDAKVLKRGKKKSSAAYLRDYRRKRKEREEIVAVNLRNGTWKHEVRE